MLHADDDGMNPRRLAVLELHRDQRLAVGREVGQEPLAAYLVDPARQAVRQNDGQRHALGRVEARIAKQRGLLRSLCRTGLGSPMRHARDDAAGVGVEAALRGVADVGDDVSRDPRDIDTGVRDGVDGQEDQAGRDRALRRNFGAGVLKEKRVHDRVRDLIADLVRVTSRHGFRREDRSSSHVRLLALVRSSATS